MSDEHETVIPAMPTDNPAYSLSRVGIRFHGELDHDGWVELGTQLGDAGRSIGFLIGDWLNYGDGKGEWGDTYTEAMRITGLEYKTLRDYASVSRKVQLSLRNDNLAYELHKKVAPLKDETEQKKWLQVAEKQAKKGKPISSRRLAKSILLGRVAKDSDMSTPENDRGRDNVHPHVNRLVAFWGKMKREGFLENADVELMKNMMTDLSPVVDIYHEIETRIAEIESQ